MHDRPGANRVVGKVELIKGDYGDAYPRFVSNEFPEEIDWTDEVLDKVLKPFVGKTLHLQCEYMA